MSVQRLLVVEDDPSWRECLEEAARAEGCEVTLASDGLEALRCLGDTTRARPNLILLDLLMPRMDGWELYGRLRVDGELRRIPVMLMSVAGGRDMALGGVVGFLRKSPSPEPTLLELRERLRGLSVPELPREPSGPYALHLTEEAATALRSLPLALRHGVRLHLYRAAELAGTGLPMMSTWLVALPSRPPSLLVAVEGVRVLLEVDEAGRTLTATTVIIPPHLPRM